FREDKSLIESGGGTGPMMPQQPARKGAGANSCEAPQMRVLEDRARVAEPSSSVAGRGFLVFSIHPHRLLDSLAHPVDANKRPQSYPGDWRIGSSGRLDTRASRNKAYDFHRS